MYFIDVQGTLINDSDKKPIPGSIEFINYLNSSNTPYMVVTNNTKHSSTSFLCYLNSIGLQIDKDHYIDPFTALIELIDKHDEIAAYGSDEFLQLLRDMGYKLNFISPVKVLISVKQGYLFDEFAQMIDFLLGGADLVGMHETTLYVKNSKRYPGVGALLQMLSSASCKPYTVVGKPSVYFYTQALNKLRKQNKNADFSDITIISDDLKGDLISASKLGMKTVFVLSGKYKTAGEIIPLIAKHEHPDLIFNNIKNMMENL